MEVVSSFVFLLLSLLVSTQIFYRSKNKPGSPFALPILGHLHLIIKKPLHRSLSKLTEQYGPVLLLKYGFRRVLLVSSPSAVEECLTKNDIAFANRPHLIAGEYVGFNYSNVGWSSYGDHWRNLRRLLALEISSYRLQLFSTSMKEDIHSLLLQLSGAFDYKNFHKVDFTVLFFKLVANTLMEMIAGKRFCGENVDFDEAKRFKDIVDDSTYLTGVPNIGDYLPFLRWFDVQGLEKRMAKTCVDRDSFLQELINEHREQKEVETKARTLIGALLAHQETDPEYYTDKIIQGIIAALLTSGTDTTSMTMEWVMSLLLNHPESLNKAREEIDAHVGQERLLEESDLPYLPYLNNIINETLRLYPVGPVLTHESSTDCSVGDTHVASGTMIQMNVWAIHRDPNVWEEPLKFKPERFEVEGEKEGIKWLAFGSGRRRCPGEGLAMRMVGLTIGCLIQCFEWKRVGEEMVDMSERAGNTSPRVKPLVAMCRPRSIIKGIITNS